MCFNSFVECYCVLKGDQLGQRLCLLLLSLYMCGGALAGCTICRLGCFSWVLLFGLRSWLGNWNSINPFECLLPWLKTFILVLYYLTHLCVYVSIMNYHLFFLQLLLKPFTPFKRSIIEVEREWTEPPIAKPLLVLLQLLDEVAPDLQVRPPWVQVLKRLQHGPAVLAHEVRSQDDGGAGHATDRVDKHGFELLYGVFNEVEDRVCWGVLGVEDNLVFDVEHVKGQVDHTLTLPVIRYLSAGTVDDVRDLVGYDEFLILKCAQKV